MPFEELNRCAMLLTDDQFIQSVSSLTVRCVGCGGGGGGGGGEGGGAYKKLACPCYYSISMFKNKRDLGTVRCDK